NGTSGPRAALRPMPSIASVIVLGLAIAACGDHAPPGASRGSLPEGVVAQVGPRTIAATSVARIAAAQSLPPDAARDAAVRDALLASGAENEGLAGTRDARLAVDAVLARRMLRELGHEVAQAPITDEELQRATDKRWIEFARPEGSRTVHVVVLFNDKTE